MTKMTVLTFCLIYGIIGLLILLYIILDEWYFETLCTQIDDNPELKKYGPTSLAIRITIPMILVWPTVFLP